MIKGKIVILHVFIDGMNFKEVANNYDSIPDIENLYYFFSPDKSFRLKKINDDRVRIINDFNEYVSLFSNPDIDVVLFYSLPYFYYYLFDYIDDSKVVIWWAWGYDLYNGQGPYPPLIDMELYKPRTKEFMLHGARKVQMSVYLKRKVYLLLTLPVRTYRNIKNRQNKLPSPQKSQDEILSRIDASYTPLNTEFYYLRSAHPSFTAEMFPRPARPVNYPFMFHKEPGNVLVNHSLTYSTNHLDVFESLYGVKLANERKYVFPVSYGINGYNGDPSVLQKQSHFPEHQTLWLTERLPYDAYVSILNSVTHAVFGMLRQQGVGNVSLCLRKGVKIFLYKDSLVYQSLKTRGYICFSIEDDLSTESLSSCLDENEARWNYELLMKERQSYSSIKCRAYLEETISRKQQKRDNE